MSRKNWQHALTAPAPASGRRSRLLSHSLNNLPENGESGESAYGKSPAMAISLSAASEHWTRGEILPMLPTLISPGPPAKKSSQLRSSVVCAPDMQRTERPEFRRAARSNVRWLRRLCMAISFPNSERMGSTTVVSSVLAGLLHGSRCGRRDFCNLRRCALFPCCSRFLRSFSRRGFWAWGRSRMRGHRGDARRCLSDSLAIPILHRRYLSGIPSRHFVVITMLLGWSVRRLAQQKAELVNQELKRQLESGRSGATIGRRARTHK